MLETLNCNSCGAPIDVPDQAKFVRCNHCNTNLQIRRTSGVTFTAAVDRLAETTEDLAGQVEKLNRRSEIEALDRSWEMQRGSFVMQSKHGGTHLPQTKGNMVGAIGAAAFGVLWTIIAIGITQTAPAGGPFSIAKIVFPMFGLLFIAMAIYTGLYAKHRTEEYQRAEQEYRRRREELLRED